MAYKRSANSAHEGSGSSGDASSTATLSRDHTIHIDGSGLLTLTGVGGTGKTRLALQAAAGLLDVFPDGHRKINLCGLHQGFDVIGLVQIPGIID